ncbi:hypothetical protein OJAV_G00184080 [Oryzias javanicus]|uniref:Uncharacterized protein n=1 Tax=Oryzias javanicus TaxID=123683 RepID=A0A3S2LTB8_ORYJA|nr:hypothetical protein OJAV_G00184080 [Oryzias javanicus]
MRICRRLCCSVRPDAWSVVFKPHSVSFRVRTRPDVCPWRRRRSITSITETDGCPSTPVQDGDGRATPPGPDEDGASRLRRR